MSSSNVRVNNFGTTAWTPIQVLRDNLHRLSPGQRVYIDNTREEILRTQSNLMSKRHEIPGADSHLEYIEALLIAEAENKLHFKK
jgi:hypothetical protein